MERVHRPIQDRPRLLQLPDQDPRAAGPEDRREEGRGEEKAIAIAAAS